MKSMILYDIKSLYHGFLGVFFTNVIDSRPEIVRIFFGKSSWNWSENIFTIFKSDRYFFLNLWFCTPKVLLRNLTFICYNTLKYAKISFSEQKGVFSKFSPKFLKGQTTSDETVRKIFITKQIILHNFTLPVFFSKDFVHFSKFAFIFRFFFIITFFDFIKKENLKGQRLYLL